MRGPERPIGATTRVTPRLVVVKGVCPCTSAWTVSKGACRKTSVSKPRRKREAGADLPPGGAEVVSVRNQLEDDGFVVGAALGRRDPRVTLPLGGRFPVRGRARARVALWELLTVAG